MIEERTETCYLYIKLPRLGVKLPPMPEDPSPRHVTILYVGKVTEAQYDAVCLAVASEAGIRTGRANFTILGGVDYFEIANGRAAIARVVGDKDCLSDMHVQAHAAVLTVRGLEDYQSRITLYGSFNPHVTLAYLRDGEEYDGPWTEKCEAYIQATRIHCDWGSVRSVSISYGIYDENPDPNVHDAEAALELIRRMVNHQPTSNGERLRLPKGTGVEDVIVEVAEYLDRCQAAGVTIP